MSSPFHLANSTPDWYPVHKLWTLAPGRRMTEPAKQSAKPHRPPGRPPIHPRCRASITGLRLPPAPRRPGKET